jgi:uncharacterized protein YdeI (YjbR/CyaY-like superfamily)
MNTVGIETRVYSTNTIEIKLHTDLRKWLAENHGSNTTLKGKNGEPAKSEKKASGPPGGVWLINWKKHTPHYVSWGDILSELLCWGWVDSQTRKVDADLSSRWISPRNPNYAWSGINKVKVAELRAADQMQPPGEASIAASVANGMWTFLDDVEWLELPSDLADALSANKEAATSKKRKLTNDYVTPTVAQITWETYPSSVKRAALVWIKRAKKEETRATRIAAVV